MELVAQCDDQVYDKPARSLSLALEAYQLAEELEDDSLIAVTLNRVGSAQWSLGNEIEALEKIQQSLQIAETRGYEALMAKKLWQHRQCLWCCWTGPGCNWLLSIRAKHTREARQTI